MTVEYTPTKILTKQKLLVQDYIWFTFYAFIDANILFYFGNRNCCHTHKAITETVPSALQGLLPQSWQLQAIVASSRLRLD